MAETNDGFEIARRDLEIRGPGEFMGARQSRRALLRFADLADRCALLEWAAPPRRCCWTAPGGWPPCGARLERWLGGKSEDRLKA
jgi:ATP-dependent DNA helicase RecG